MNGNNKPKSVLAKEENGTIQLTITIPSHTVKKAENEVLEELAKTTEVPGYRRGFAPVEEIKKRVSAQTVLERLLAKVLPISYSEAVREHNIRPILSPKIELVSAKEGEDWQVRAITCEAPSIEVGDYKKELEAAKRANSLWTPGKRDKKDPTSEDKQQLVIETLLKTINATIPNVLIEEEVNHRLAQLVDQTQKLGLSVDQYLAQTGKTAGSLREEYRKQAQDQIKLMLVLQTVGREENLEVEEDEINKIMGETATQKVQKNGQDAQNTQRELIKSVLLRRKALDRLVSFV